MSRLLALLSSPMNFNHAASLAIFCILLAGYFLRSDRRLHKRCMLTAFCLDVALVLWIEISRHAIEKSLGVAGYKPPGPLLLFHIAVSVLVLILYIAQIVLGVRFTGQPQGLQWHRRCGRLLLACRFANIVTSFMIV